MKKYLILPNIRSCHNVGAMFRNADAFGFDRLYLVGYTAQPPKPQIDKVSLGAETWINWEHRDELGALIQEMREKNVMILGLEKGERSMGIGELGSIEKDIALIVGNEVDGISEEALALCDTVVHIPMHGKKESLNVSVAAGVAMYVLAQQ